MTASPPPGPAPDLQPLLRRRVMLRFSDAALEADFVRDYLAIFHRYAQVALMLGMLLLVGDFLVDRAAYPQLQANGLRLTLAVPMLLAGLAYSFLPQARQHWQPVLASLIVATSVCLFWILLRIDAEGGQGLTSWVGILNFTFLAFY